jgi:hypothetical protein
MLGKQNCELAPLDCLRGANEPESGFSPIAFAKSSARMERACSIPRQSGELDLHTEARRWNAQLRAPAEQNSEGIDDRSKGLNRWFNQARSP